MPKHVSIRLHHRIASRTVLPCRQPHEEHPPAAMQERVQEACSSIGVQADLSTPVADPGCENCSATNVTEAQGKQGATCSHAGQGWFHLGSPVADLKQRLQRWGLASGKHQASHRWAELQPINGALDKVYPKMNITHGQDESGQTTHENIFLLCRSFCNPILQPRLNLPVGAKIHLQPDRTKTGAKDGPTSVEIRCDELCSMTWLQSVLALSLELSQPITNFLSRPLSKDKKTFLERMADICGRC